MAQTSDVELSIGLNTKNYEEELNRLVQHTKDALSGNGLYSGTGIQDLLGNKFTYGAVNAPWSKWQNAAAHVTGSDELGTIGGMYNMTGNLMRGVYNDMRASGYSTRGLYNQAKYSDAMAAASLRVAVDDASERKGMLNAYGLGGAGVMADNAKEGPGKIIEDNYRLMQQEWAQDMVYKKSTRLRKDGTRLRTRGDADFQQMREYAVDIGMAKWTDSTKHDAEHFEFIDKEIAKIQDKSDKTNKLFTSWGDGLKGVLGTLTAISALAAVGIAFGKKSINEVEDAASNMPNDRWFYNMSTDDVLRTRVAGNSLGVGDKTFYNGIKTLAQMRTNFKTLGKDMDPVYSSLLGVFDDIVTSSADPMDAYIQIAQKLVDNEMGLNPEKMGTLIDKLGLPGMGDLVAAVSDPSRDIKNVASLFELKSNPYYGAYGDAEELQKELTPYQESIKATMQQLYNDFTEIFGLPFIKWWDKTLIRLTPKLETFVSKFDSLLGHEEDKENFAFWATDAVMQGLFDDVDPTKGTRKKLSLADQVWTDAKYISNGRTRYGLSEADMRQRFGELYNDRSKLYFRGFQNNEGGVTGSIFYGDLQYLANLDIKEGGKGYDMVQRAKAALSVINAYGASSIFTDTKETNADQYLANLVRRYVATNASGSADDLVKSIEALIAKMSVPDFSGSSVINGGAIETPWGNVILNVNVDKSGNVTVDKVLNR